MRSMMLQSIPLLDYATNEAINTLTTNVIFSGTDYKRIMITSCVANEGKSFVCFQLANRMANLGYSVMLVDADIRKSVFLSRYEVTSPEPLRGLTHYLAGRCSQEQVEYATNIANLHVIPAGKEVINSLPLLNSAAFVDLMKNLRNRFDFVFVDAPPVGLLVDAAMIASACDGTILVVTNEQVSKRELRNAIQQIRNSGCEILGSVLNKVAMGTHKSRKYYYKSYYSHYNNYSNEDGNTAYNDDSKSSAGFLRKLRAKKDRADNA